MSFIPKTISQKMARDTAFKGIPETTLNVQLGRRMTEICATYTNRGHKQVWEALDRYALHALVLSYALERSQEEEAFSDIQMFEIHAHGLEEEDLAVLALLDNHLWLAMTCRKRKEFVYHCDVMRHGVRASETARGFAMGIINKLRRPGTLEKSDDFVGAFTYSLWVRLNDRYQGDQLVCFLQRIPEIENRLLPS